MFSPLKEYQLFEVRNQGINSFMIYCMRADNTSTQRLFRPSERSITSLRARENIGNKEPLDYRVMWSRETAVPFFFISSHFLFFFHLFRYTRAHKMRSRRKDRKVGRFASFPFFLSFISLLLSACERIRASLIIATRSMTLNYIANDSLQFCQKKASKRQKMRSIKNVMLNKKSFEDAENVF